jgi:predicted permease
VLGGVKAFEAVAAVTDRPRTELKGDGLDDSLRAAMISPNALDVIGVSPIVGRRFDESDAESQPASTFIISDRLWTRLGRDRQLVGRQFSLGGHLATLVGILPPGCTIFDADVYTTAAVQNAGQASFFYMWARLSTGATREQAEREFRRAVMPIAASDRQQYPQNFAIHALSLPESVTGTSRVEFYNYAAAAITLLLIAVANALCLGIGRRIDETDNMAIYAALGANWRWRGPRAVAELLVVAVPALVWGTACALVCLGLVNEFLPDGVLQQDVAIQLRGLVAVCGIAITLSVAGAVVAVKGWVGRVHGQGNAVGRRSGSPRGTNAVWGVLVGTQVALAVVLVAASAMEIRTFANIRGVALGADTNGIVSAAIRLPARRYEDVVVKQRLFRDLTERIARRPTIDAVGTASIAPVIGGMRTSIGRGGQSGDEGWTSLLQICSSGYFSVARSQLINGRVFTVADDLEGRHVAVINEAMASQYFTSTGATGQLVWIDRLARGANALRNPVFEVVGVIHDERNHGITNPALPEIYVPIGAAPSFSQVLLVRAMANEVAVGEQLRQVLKSIEPDATVSSVERVSNMVDRAFYAEPRFDVAVVVVFSVLGLLLVVCGVFGVSAYRTAVSAKECGIRFALGATPWRVQWLIAKTTLRVVALGLSVGCIAAWFLGGVMKSQVWGVSPQDPASIILGAIAVGCVGLLGAYAPVRRISTLDSASILRSE